MMRTSDLPTLSEIKHSSRNVSSRGYVLMSLARPFGPYLAWIAFRAGLKARHVTYGSVLFGLVIMILASSGSAFQTTVGMMLVVVWQMMDVTDGTMARALGLRDNFGGFVDYAAGVSLIAFLPIALSIGAARGPDGSLSSFLSLFHAPMHAGVIVIVSCGAFISAISMYMRVLNRTLEVRFGTSIAADGATKAKWDGITITRLIIRNFETIGGVQAFVFAVASATHVLELALFCYVVFQLALFLAFATSVFRNYSRKTEYLTASTNAPSSL